MADDRTPRRTQGVTQPAGAGESLSVSTSVSSLTRGVWVGGAGNARFDLENGATLTFDGITAGTLLPIRVVRLRSLSTTATNIIGLW
jgi:hypothetical protein